ncbi:MAG TPA: zinc ribbon domain-containing protein [Pyrinomonadaceae bacterium]|nr:zinc ribbon domain-containing protein [Pyrinomonadaceae bacterium]HMP64307.1 zinc ribbon domain-containing protein [Pyrinomonadaceae bacterium]
MPIYEYLCKQCGVRLERRQAVTDPPLATCAECGGDLEKQWSLSGFHFKGEGWYVTDYSKNRSPKATDDDGVEKSVNTESTSAGKTASKSSKNDSPVSSSPADSKKEK